MIKVVIAVQLFYHNFHSVGIFNIFTSPAPMQRQSRRFDNYRKGIPFEDFPPQAAVDSLTMRGSMVSPTRPRQLDESARVVHSNYQEVMGLYFISDPDGYWIEIMPSKNAHEKQ